MIPDIANYYFHIKNMNGASVHSVNSPLDLCGLYLSSLSSWDWPTSS